ncbi:MAG: cellobiose phosphorylase, partial [Candidatus Omnitrophica bacterium]|nr:cellobiose phosphorylase [Candidatus Omnitrophota bacterium]
MIRQNLENSGVQYGLDEQGCFVIDQYNSSKPFCNFFPGIAGIHGIPMWVFYVNRGQGICSFGVESKDRAIMEFLPANKAYRQTTLHGFRTFIKIQTGNETKYWEPFQEGLLGTQYQKEQRMAITAHDLTLMETNHDLGLQIELNYFTLPEEFYPGLFRKVTLKNLTNENISIEMIDGLPMIMPFG